MTTVGLRELRQDASSLVRRAESGEEITITVAGRASARLVAAGPKQWCAWEGFRELFDGPADENWAADRELLDDSVTDPWLRAGR